MVGVPRLHVVAGLLEDEDAEPEGGGSDQRQHPREHRWTEYHGWRTLEGMDADLDRLLLIATRVDMTRYVVIDPFDDTVTDVDLARIQGHNELLRRLKGDSFADVAEALEPVA